MRRSSQSREEESCKFTWAVDKLHNFPRCTCTTMSCSCSFTCGWTVCISFFNPLHSGATRTAYRIHNNGRRTLPSPPLCLHQRSVPLPRCSCHQRSCVIGAQMFTMSLPSDAVLYQNSPHCTTRSFSLTPMLKKEGQNRSTGVSGACGRRVTRIGDEIATACGVIT